MLKAVVFDFDGVLVDSEPLHFQAFVVVGRSIGFEFDYDDYLRRFIGFDDRDAFRLMLREADAAGAAAAGGEPLEQRVAALCRQKQAVFDQIVARGVQTIPGALDLLVAAAESMPVALCSGATRADIEQVLRPLDGLERFGAIVTADDVSRSKPDPESYRLAVERLAQRHPDRVIAPEHCVAIEDTAAGIASARAAGLRTLALTTTTPEHQLRAADRIVPDLSGVGVDELRSWFGGPPETP